MHIGFNSRVPQRPIKGRKDPDAEKAVEYNRDFSKIADYFEKMGIAAKAGDNNTIKREYSEMIQSHERLFGMLESYIISAKRGVEFQISKKNPYSPEDFGSLFLFSLYEKFNDTEFSDGPYKKSLERVLGVSSKILGVLNCLKKNSPPNEGDLKEAQEFVESLAKKAPTWVAYLKDNHLDGGRRIMKD